jgi:DNA-binding transcriptional regulator of glucitol operon
VAAASYRFAAKPKWLAGHVLVLALSVTMVLLGHWQLTVSEHKGFSLQNFGYALQWWAFTAFALAFWTKIVHDHATGKATKKSEAAEQTPDPEPEPPEPVTYRRYVPPVRAVFADDDPEVARYNEYLASLYKSDTPQDER